MGQRSKVIHVNKVKTVLIDIKRCSRSFDRMVERAGWATRELERLTSKCKIKPAAAK